MKVYAITDLILGNHIYKLLAEDGANRLVDVVEDGPWKMAMRDLLLLLGQIQRRTKASFLEDADVAELGELIDTFRQQYEVILFLN